MTNNNFFTDKTAFRTIDIYRVVYVIIVVIAFVFTEAGRYIYRPYIYENHINDFGVADSIGNSGGIIVQIFLMLAVLNSPRKKALRVIAFIMIGYTFYEFIQPYLPKGTFDWYDVYGTLVGGVISLILYLIITRFIKNKELFKFK